MKRAVLILLIPLMFKKVERVVKTVQVVSRDYKGRSLEELSPHRDIGYREEMVQFFHTYKTTFHRHRH
jgi:hypothetical protein